MIKHMYRILHSVCSFLIIKLNYVYSFLDFKINPPVVINHPSREERNKIEAKSLESLLNCYLQTRMGAFGCDIIDGPLQFDKKILLTYGENFVLADISHDIREALVGGMHRAVWVRVIPLPGENIPGICTVYPCRVIAGSFRKTGQYPNILNEEI